MTVIVFLSGKSMNDALGSSGRALADVFEPLRQQFIEIDLSRSDAFQFLDETIKSHSIECVMSHVGMAADVTGRTADGREVNYWAANRLTFISLYGDSPRTSSIPRRGGSGLRVSLCVSGT